MRPPEQLAADARGAFERVHREVFLGDPVANSRLVVDIVDAGLVADTSVLVLVAPWTVNGLLFPPDGDFPDVLELAGRRRRVFCSWLPGLGAFHSVNLPVEATTVHDMRQARILARSWVVPLHEAVRAARAGRRRTAEGARHIAEGSKQR